MAYRHQPCHHFRRAALIFIAMMLVIFCGTLRAQEEISKKQSQLQKLKNEIESYEKRIKEREKKEHATLELLDTYDRQATLLRKLIRKLQEEELDLQKNIGETRKSIADLSGQISYLKQHYALYVGRAYRKGPMYDLELLLSSKSFNQLLIRSEYLKRFSDQRRKDLDDIDTRRSTREDEKSRLEDQLAAERKLLTEKATEEGKLASKVKKRKGVLADIRKDKKNFKREITRKVEAARDLEQLITKLIEQDRIKKERDARTAKGKNPKETDRDAVAGTGFESRRGRLRWPVTQGKVIAHFGAQEHPVLHTITQNTGIDISVPVGTSVSSIADGEVSTIWWLPSFGNLLILNHKNGYRTVYAHLSEISVNEGDRVGEGDLLGKSGEALSGPVLHFEIWKDRDKQDPERWLHPRGLTQR